MPLYSIEYDFFEHSNYCTGWNRDNLTKNIIIDRLLTTLYGYSTVTHMNCWSNTYNQTENKERCTEKPWVYDIVAGLAEAAFTRLVLKFTLWNILNLLSLQLLDLDMTVIFINFR